MAGPSGIPSYSTTPATNATADGGASNWAENQAPSTVNNTARQNLADIRSAFNDLIWFSYGSGDQASGTTYLGVPYVYASSTSVTIAGVDVTAAHHAGRRMKFVGTATGTIYGTISSSSFSTNTTINLVFDSGSLSNETLTGYLSQVPVTGSPVPGTAIASKGVIYEPSSGGTGSAITLTNVPPISAYATGQLFLFSAPATVGAGATVNVDTKGAKSLLFRNVAVLASSYLSGDLILIEYDGTNFQIIAPLPRFYPSQQINALTGDHAVFTGATANALTVGRNGTTNPVFNVNTSSGIDVGFEIVGNTSPGAAVLNVISSATNENAQVNAKGSGTYSIAPTSTGNIILNRAIQYGGVTLSNAVTGTGNMVLSASPTLTGTLTAAGITASGLLQFNGSAATTYRIINASGMTTGGAYIQMANTGSNALIGIESSTGNSIVGSASAYAAVLATLGATSLQFGTNNVVNYTITSGAIAITQNSTGFQVSSGVVATGAAALNSSIAFAGELSAAGARYGLNFVNSSAGTTAQAIVQAQNGTHSAFFEIFGTGFTTSGINRQDGMLVGTDGAGGLTLATATAQPVYFAINSTEAARFSTSGFFLAGLTTSIAGTAHGFANSGSNVNVCAFQNSHASAPIGIYVFYSAATPNDTAHEFLYCQDSTGLKASLRSNGGLANFSANNVNLSDAEAKPQIEPLISNKRLASDLWNAHRQIDWNRHKYADQTHGDWNYGYTAQGIQKAFGAFAPELVERDPAFNGMLVVYHHDISNISGAVLTMAQDRIEDHEARIRRLEGVQ